MRPEDFLAEQEEPFIQKEFIAKTQMSTEEAKTVLKNMVADSILGFRKVGRMNVYWPIKGKEIPHEEASKEEPPKKKTPKSKIKSTDELSKLRDRVLDLEQERDLLLNENQKIKHEFERFQAKFSDEEDAWREVAERMATSLADMQGITIKKVLEYFDAPHY